MLVDVLDPITSPALNSFSVAQLRTLQIELEQKSQLVSRLLAQRTGTEVAPRPARTSPILPPSTRVSPALPSAPLTDLPGARVSPPSALPSGLPGARVSPRLTTLPSSTLPSGLPSALPGTPLAGLPSGLPGAPLAGLPFGLPGARVSPRPALPAALPAAPLTGGSFSLANLPALPTLPTSSRMPVSGAPALSSLGLPSLTAAGAGIPIQPTMGVSAGVVPTTGVSAGVVPTAGVSARTIPGLDVLKLGQSRGRAGYTAANLKDFLRSVNLKMTGTKDELVTRLQNYLAGMA